ncbi:unnamed protein product [Effrenium voratum]|nr:unnamed protein product [Effrenium voratum]
MTDFTLDKSSASFVVDLPETQPFRKLWALIQEASPHLTQQQHGLVFENLFSVMWEHPAWSTPAILAEDSYASLVLSQCDRFPAGLGLVSRLQLARLRLLRPVAKFLWATKEIALALWRKSGAGALRAARAVLRSAASPAERSAAEAAGGAAWLGTEPRAAAQVLQQIPEFVRLVRAASREGYHKVVQANQLFILLLHDLEHLVTSAPAGKPLPLLHFDTRACCHRSEVLKLLLGDLRRELPEERLSVVEIGVGWGVTSYYAMSADANLQYLGIDPHVYPGKQADAVTAVPGWALSAAASARLIYERLGGQLIRGLDRPVGQRVANESVHLVFIDGRHDARSVRRDLRSWLPKVVPGGFVVGHDFSFDWPGVAEAVCAWRAGRVVSFGADHTFWPKVAQLVAAVAFEINGAGNHIQRAGLRQRPVTRAQSAARSSRAPAAKAVKTPYPIPGDVGYYQRADVKGRIKKPKLDKDMAKLRDLFTYCEVANFREVRAMVSHYPYLLGLTDAHGFSALHHAVMSGDSLFISKVLELYRDPKTFSLKNLVYETEEELLRDMELGVKVVGRKTEDSEATVKVMSIGPGSKAEEAGLMPGDDLEACSGTGFLSYRQPPPISLDVLESLQSKHVSTSFGFPVTMEFRGNAAVEILAKDGWTPCHGAAGRGAHSDKQILWQLLSEEEKAQLVQDMTGCTPHHWSQIEQRMRQRSKRRPLSAGPCGGTRRPAKTKGTTLRPFTAKPVIAPHSRDAEDILRAAGASGARPRE